MNSLLFFFALGVTMMFGCDAATTQSVPGELPRPDTADSGATVRAANPSPIPGEPPDDAPKTPDRVASYAGVYSVVVPLDFTQNGVLPGLVSPALGALGELHDRPGAALCNLIKNSLGSLGTVFRQLPGFVVDGIAVVIDGIIRDHLYANVPIANQLAAIIQGITEIASKVDLRIDMTVHAPTVSGTTRIEEQVTGVDWILFGNRTTVPLPGPALSAASATTTGTVVPHANRPIADADLAVGAAAMTLPIGELLLKGLGPLLFSQFGGATDLRGAIQNLYPCATLGQDISDYLGGFVLPSEGMALCTGAIGLVSAAFTDRIGALHLDLAAEHGKGVLLDLSKTKTQVDYQSDLLTGGTWNWRVDTVNVPSTFSGPRTGVAN